MHATPWLIFALACGRGADDKVGVVLTETGRESTSPDESAPPVDSHTADSVGHDSAGHDSAGHTGHTGEGEGEGEGQTTNTIRFVALGDAGAANDTQYAVAAAMETVCAARGCDFAVYLGDNFYEDGVESADDDLFQTAFELPYAGLDFPFYVVLGNHDYGGNGLGYEVWKPDFEIAYAETSDKFVLPDNYYSFTEGPADFFGLDTNAIVWGAGDDQATWLDAALSASTSPWRIGLGHHPYISNGDHGNAGNYEGLSWLPIVNGADFETFAEDHLCGKVDIYLCGHDHSRQWLEPTCGTEFLVSGAGAKTTEIVDRDSNPYYFELGEPGFLWVEMNETTFTGVFYDIDGVSEFERSFDR